MIKRKKRGRPKKIIKVADISIHSPESESIIHSSLKILGKIFTAEGKTIAEVLTNLSNSVGNVKGRGILILEKGTVRKEKILAPFMIPRLFGHFGSIRKEIALKQLVSLFDKNLFKE